MKCSKAKFSALALVVLLAAPAGWSRQGANQTTGTPQQGGTAPQGETQQQGGRQQGQQGGDQQGGRGGNRGGAAAANKAEGDAYKAITMARTGDPGKEIDLCEAFIMKYPMSIYLPTVYAALTDGYYRTNNTEKFMDAGAKTLMLNPDDVDVLPLMAFTISRTVNSKTPDGPQQLQKAQAYASHGVALLSAMAKPASIDDATFTKGKNEKLSMCHDALGVIAVKTGKYDDAITELNQSIQLAAMPDPTDFYLLGVADESSNHFQDAIAAFTKCSAAGPLQPQCKSGVDDAKKKASTGLEAPK